MDPRPYIAQEGQAYYDREVRAAPVGQSVVRSALDAAFGVAPKKDIVLGYERVYLRWRKPGDGL